MHSDQGCQWLGNIGWTHFGEYGPWLPLIGLEYGFPMGIIIGVIVAIKTASNPNRSES
jgi:hypothetical protein